MTRRRSRREIERAIEDVADHRPSDGEARRPFRQVYRDPATGRCFEGYGPEAAPVESLPEDADLFVIERALSMTRPDAERNGREIIETVTERDDGEDVVTVRVDPAPGVDAEAAVTVDEASLGPSIDFAGADT